MRHTPGIRGGQKSVRMIQGDPHGSRRIHEHMYHQRTRQHRVNSGDGGQAISTREYSHHHNRRTHNHPFSREVREHWTQYQDDGRELSPGRYQHSHQQFGDTAQYEQIYNQYLKLVNTGQTMGLNDCVKCGNALAGGSGGTVSNCVICGEFLSTF